MRFVHDGARVLRLLAHGVHGRFEDDAFPLDHLGSCASARSVCVRPLNAWRYVDIDGWFQAPPLEAFGHAFYKLIEERTVGRARADHIHLNDPAGEVFGPLGKPIAKSISPGVSPSSGSISMLNALTPGTDTASSMLADVLICGERQQSLDDSFLLLVPPVFLENARVERDSNSENGLLVHRWPDHTTSRSRSTRRR